jgi:hypothetical protein
MQRRVAVRLVGVQGRRFHCPEVAICAGCLLQQRDAAAGALQLMHRCLCLVEIEQWTQALMARCLLLGQC